MAAVMRQLSTEPVPVDPSPGDLDGSTEIGLAKGDLIADARGEIVLFNDSGVRTLRLSTSTRAVAEGLCGRHVTLGGDDVSGHRYLAFADDTKLFFAPPLNVVVVEEGR